MDLTNGKDWSQPVDVSGWLTEAEGEYLVRLARDKVVLEIGSYCGLSTICLARAAVSVDAVDPLDGRGTPAPRDTCADLLANLQRHKVRHKVTVHRGTSSEVMPTFRRKFDLAFIDGAHEFNNVLTDARLAAEVLLPGGLLAFHDYDPDPAADCSITVLVNDLVKRGSKLVSRVNSLVTITPPDSWPDPRPFVFIALPARPGDQMNSGLLMSTHNLGKGFASAIQTQSCSLLTTNFNLLWCEALNRRPMVTHFVMCHDDIIPEAGWVEKLLNEQRRTQADILSVCVAMKDQRGLTSTGVMDWDTRRMRKLAIREVLALPTSFTAETAGFPDQCLLLNSGLWICDFTQPWVERMCFRQKDTIVRQANGQWRPASVSEDWLFSIDANRLGLVTMATTVVKCVHKGVFDYPNFTPWGTEEREADSVAAVAWDINPPESWGWEREAVGIPIEEGVTA